MIVSGQDVRFALRQIRKAPGYAVIAIVTLALGIGANTAIFLLTYSILLKSLPVPDPGRLVGYSLSAKGADDLRMPYALYHAMRERQPRLFSASFDPTIPLRDSSGPNLYPRRTDDRQYVSGSRGSSLPRARLRCKCR